MLGWFQKLLPEGDRFFDLFEQHALALAAGAIIEAATARVIPTPVAAPASALGHFLPASFLTGK